MTNPSMRVRWSGGDRTFAPGDTVLIGRDVLSTVRLTDDRVSRRHAELRLAPEGWMLVDLGSTSGTFVGGQRVAELAIRTPTTVRFGGQATVSDVVFEPVGESSARAVTQNPTELAAPVVLEPTILPPPPAHRPGGALAPGAAAGATEIADASLQVQFSGQTRSASPGQVLRVGRDPGAELSTENPTVSREHARILHSDGAWYLEDAGSTRGTFLDGRRISRERIVGSTAFVLGPPETGERLVAVAAGADRPTRRTRYGTVAVVLAAVACAIALIAVAGVVLTRGDSSPAADLTQLREATVFISAGDGSGSGSIIDGERGLILTAAHVVQPDAPGIGVQYGDTADVLPESPEQVLISLSQADDEPAEPAFLGEVVAWDGYLDLAVVRIEETIGGRIIEDDEDLGLPEVPIGDSRDIDQGAALTVIGYPGIDETNSSTAEEGTISGFVPDRRLDDNRAWINSSVPIKRGHSGGLAADASGRLVAVPLMESSDSVDTIARLRPIHLAAELIFAAEDDEEYVSPFVTPVEGEEIENVDLATDGPPLATSCRDRETDGPQSADALSIMFDYAGFPEGHQDLLVRVFAGGSEIGRVAAADSYPVEWGGSGCAAVTVPLRSVPEAGQEIAVFVDVGPNYELALSTVTLTA